MGWRRAAAGSSRSPTCSITTSRAAGCSPASTTGTGPTPARCRPSSAPLPWRPRTTPPAGSHPQPVARRADVTDERRFERLLVTGGAGFIGSCYVRDILGRRDGTRITVLYKLTYAGNEANLASVRADPEMAARLTFVRGDITDPEVV